MHQLKHRARARTAAIRTLLTVAAATVVMSSGITESLAKSRQQQSRHHHNHHAQKAKKPQAALRDAYASLGPARHSGRSFSGIASYYGNNVGNKTASGQRFNENAMTAAHRHLPFGTRVKVTHRNRSVIVTINDRGPFIRGRVIDLSKGAARVIGLTGRGIGHVVAEVQ